MTQFKDKSTDNTSSGLFTYPVLMASDILLYSAKWVPVGEDQTQHLEFTRDLAQRFNAKFGDIFTIPETVSKQHDFVGRSQGARIRSLRNPDKKMSKSVEDPNGTIQLSDTPDEAIKKVMSSTTDSVGVINFDWDKQPGITNLLQMLALLSNKSQDEVNKQWVGKTRYGDLKKTVADEVSETLETLQSILAKVDEAKLMTKLEQSELSMNIVANKKLLQVQKAVGLR